MIFLFSLQSILVPVVIVMMTTSIILRVTLAETSTTEVVLFLTWWDDFGCQNVLVSLILYMQHSIIIKLTCYT